MELQDLLGQARDAVTVKRVFGEPCEKNGVTLVPVARVMGGAGWGGPSGPAAAAGATAGEPHTAASTGMGYGVMASPAGIYVIAGDRVTWQPAVDVNRLAVVGGAVAIVFFLTLRSIVMALARR